MNVSNHFTLEELTRTSFKILNEPDSSARFYLQRLAIFILEPIRDRFGALIVNSGFRCKEVNDKVNGAKDSAHLYGCAADIVPTDVSINPCDMMDWLSTSAVPFDQVIDEGSWLHVGGLRPGHEQQARRQLLIQRSGRYSVWQPQA